MEKSNTESLTPVHDTSRFEAQSSANPSTLDQLKDTVADKLKSASSALKEKAARAEPNSSVASYADKASGWLGGASDYVREMNPTQVKSDLQRQVRTNPGRTLLIAGAAGLLLGALLRRR